MQVGEWSRDFSLAYTIIMKRTAAPFVLIFLLIISVALNVYLLFLQPKENLNLVNEVIDGDTFILKTGERVRLLGVDAPEKGRCMSEEATQALSTLVLNKNVSIREEKPDNFGRRMGLVYVGNSLINIELIRLGFAKPDYTKNSQKQAFIDAFNEAKDNNLGIHSVCKLSDPLPTNPKCVIKGNIDQATGKKFYHLPNCSHYKQIVLDTSTQEQFFCSEKEAVDAGFQKASGCN